MDRGRQLAHLKGLTAGDEIELTREHVVTCSTRSHTIPSRGFVVWERRNKLKDEYIGLPGDKIKELKLAGTAITREVRIPIVAYTGDTAAGGPGRVPGVFRRKDPDHRDEFRAGGPPARQDPKFGHCTWTTSWSAPRGSRTN